MGEKCDCFAKRLLNDSTCVICNDTGIVLPQFVKAREEMEQRVLNGDPDSPEPVGFMTAWQPGQDVRPAKRIGELVDGRPKV